MTWKLGHMSESTALVDPMASVRAYLAAEKSSSTRRGYAAGRADFATRWGTVSEDPLPVRLATVARYGAQLADGGRKASTIQRRVAAIRSAHQAAGFELRPTPSRHDAGHSPHAAIEANPQETDNGRAVVIVLEHLPKTLAAQRDRAILLVGFAAAPARARCSVLRSLR